MLVNNLGSFLRTLVNDAFDFLINLPLSAFTVAPIQRSVPDPFAHSKLRNIYFLLSQKKKKGNIKERVRKLYLSHPRRQWSLACGISIRQHGLPTH